MGYDEAEISAAENRCEYTFPNTIKILFTTIGKELGLTKCRSFALYEPTQIKTATAVWDLKECIGIEFAVIANAKVAYFENLKDKDNVIRYIFPGDWMWSHFYDPESDLMYRLVLAAQENMHFSLSVKCRDVEKTLYTLMEQFDFMNFNSYKNMPESNSGLMYSLKDHMLLSYDSDEKNKIVIASNMNDGLMQIEKLFKVTWLKKNGAKIIDEKLYCYESSPQTFSEKILGIYNVYFGKNVKFYSEALSKFSVDIQKIIPEEMKLFYETFYYKNAVFEGMYDIVKPQNMRLVDGKVLFAEEQQGVCKYFVDLENNVVYYSDDSNFICEQIHFDDFLLYILLIQGTGFMPEQCEVSRSEELMHFFNVFSIGDMKVYINVKRRILGYSFDENTVHLMSKSESALDKLEQDSGILFEYF